MEHKKTTTPVRFCSVEMKETLPYIAYDYKCLGDIIVKFNFRHYHEVHLSCIDMHSPYSEDHDIVYRELVKGSSFEAALAFPFNRKTVERYLAGAKLGDNWTTADYVTPSVWNEIKKHVADFIIEKAVFESSYGFEMQADIEVSTALIPCSSSFSMPPPAWAAEY